MKRMTCLTVLALAAGLFFSCTEGMYEGAGGGGNFNLIDRTNAGDLNGKYIFAAANTGLRGIALFPRQKVSNGKVSAPLYYTDTGSKYTGSDSFSAAQFTVSVYETEIAPDPVDTRSFAVKFYSGSGLIEWTEN